MNFLNGWSSNFNLEAFLAFLIFVFLVLWKKWVWRHCRHVASSVLLLEANRLMVILTEFEPNRWQFWHLVCSSVSASFASAQLLPEATESAIWNEQNRHRHMQGAVLSCHCRQPAVFIDVQGSACQLQFSCVSSWSAVYSEGNFALNAERRCSGCQCY